MPNPTINLALAFDERYVTPFYVLLTSLFINNKDESIAIHLIATGLSEGEKQDIITYVEKHGGEAAFYDISEQKTETFILPDHEGNYLSAAIYYRLFFPFILPESVKRLLYIDVDTLVVGNLAELFTVNLKGHPAAAVTDTDMPVRDELGIYNKEEYFNSGVLLIDIALWKEQKITEKALKIIQEEPELIKRYPDQDALNMALKNNWYQLPTCYNLMRLYVPNEVPKRDFPKFLKQQKIIHYNGKKPWYSDCEHRLRHVYHQYLRLSPRSEDNKIIKVNLSRKKKNMLFRSRLIDFYFDHPELISIWRRLKSLIS